jgi:linoleate 10R-lipoxygenase
MTDIFSLIPKLPEDSETSKSLNDFLIKVLYESVPHPPTSYLGEDRFRRADGARTNVNIPDMGRAGTMYARNIQGKHILPPHTLPDSSVVYDELLKTTGVSVFRLFGRTSIF